MREASEYAAEAAQVLGVDTTDVIDMYDAVVLVSYGRLTHIYREELVIAAAADDKAIAEVVAGTVGATTSTKTPVYS
jgi:hypothetical protein